MEVTISGSSNHSYSQGPKGVIKTWKLGQGAHRGKTQTSEKGAGRLVPESQRGHKEADVTSVLEKLQTRSSCCCRKKLLLPE